MPFWCGDWGTSWSGFWWIFPLLCMAGMAVMLFVCLRGFGWMCRRAPAHPPDEVEQLHREISSLKEEVRKLGLHPN